RGFGCSRAEFRNSGVERRRRVLVPAGPKKFKSVDGIGSMTWYAFSP
ncbi:unnamed protein product, partial [Ectocarpus sp. 13 AM-2016]